MSHWAEVKLVDGKKIVDRVLVGNNSEPDEGYQWLIDNLGGEWIKTSYNATIRKNYAGIGYEYDETRDAFIPPKLDCHPELVTLDEETCNWLCPDASHVIILGEE